MLNPDQLQALAAVDRPIPTEKDAQALVNVRESDVTYLRDTDATYVYKCFESGGRSHVLDAVANAIVELAPDERRTLSDASVDRATRLALAARRLTPMRRETWRFPEADRHSASLRNGAIRTLMINTTEQCNIRCTYCYYGGGYAQTRTHQNSRPQIEHVRLMVDKFLAANEDAAGATRAIYFFGGEPLLNFGLLRDAVEYFYREASSAGIDVDNVVIQVNTNGLLLNDEMMEFFDRHGVFMNFSLDGPNHDTYRVDARAKGTHDRVRAKLDWMTERYPEYVATRVALVCVISPPVTAPDLYQYFAAGRSTRSVLNLDFDLLMAGGDVDYAEDDLDRLKSALWEMFIALHEREADYRATSMIEWFVTNFNFLHRAFHRVLVRDERVAEDGRVSSLLGLQGIPGLFLVMLGADGKLYSTFEFQAPEFEIGSATEGVELAAAAERAREFRQIATSTSCSTCWAARLCNIDYPDLAFTPSDSDEDVQRKARLKTIQCAAQRRDLTDALVAHEEIRSRYGDDSLTYDRALWDREVAGGNRPGDVL